MLQPDVHMMTVIAVTLYLAHLIVISPREHVVIIGFVFMLTVINAYNWYNERKKQGKTTAARVEDAANVSQSLRTVEGSYVPKNVNEIAKVIIASDTILVKALQRLEEFESLCKELTHKSIDLVFKFYELYVKTLMSDKNNINSNVIQDLSDIRRSMLNTVNTLYMQTTNKDKEIERIVLSLQACTYRCMNILKNKYDTMQYVPPIPSNSIDNADMY